MNGLSGLGEAEPPKGTPANPLTREDVLRMRDEFVAAIRTLKDPSEKDLILDLHDMVFGPGIDLSDQQLSDREYRGDEVEVLTWQANLQGAALNDAVLQGANLERVNLSGASLRRANLKRANFQHAVLRGARLQGADLESAHLEDADLRQANLREARLKYANGPANLEGAKFEGVFLEAYQFDKSIETVHWGSCVLGEEHVKRFGVAISIYRELKMWHNFEGVYDRVGEFFYRETECRRKQARQEKRWDEWLKLGFYRFLFGYGERPWRVAGWAFGSIFLLSLVYSLLGGIPFMNALYFSAVSFTAVGYGFSLRETNIPEWAQGLGAVEALWGVLLIALFLTTFVRKMTR